MTINDINFGPSDERLKKVWASAVSTQESHDKLVAVLKEIEKDKSYTMEDKLKFSKAINDMRINAHKRIKSTSDSVLVDTDQGCMFLSEALKRKGIMVNVGDADCIDFSGMKIEGVILAGACFVDCNFEGAEFKDARVHGKIINSELNGVIFDGCDLDEVKFTITKFNGVAFSNCSLARVHIDRCSVNPDRPILMCDNVQFPSNAPIAVQFSGCYRETSSSIISRKFDHIYAAMAEADEMDKNPTAYDISPKSRVANFPSFVAVKRRRCTCGKEIRTDYLHCSECRKAKNLD